MNRTRKILSVALGCIAALCLIAAVVILIRYASDSRRNEQVTDDLRASAESLESLHTPVVPTASPEPAGTPVPTATPEPVATATPEPTPAPVENPYKDSYLANDDMAAWLQIPDTVIDYPVMWTPEDENYYLRRGFDKSKNNAGCLILDTDSCVDPLTTNLIIHGHNMNAGTMFGTLSDYEKESFFQEHRNIILYTEACQRNYEVIAVFRSQVYKKKDQVFKFYKFFQADTEEEFNDFYDNIKAMSLYDTGVTAEFGDRFLTLSTCSYHVETGRFVVVAKEIEPGDTYLPIGP